jgi:hypothetical protein
MARVIRMPYQYRKTDRTVLTFLAIFELNNIAVSSLPSSFLIFTSYFLPSVPIILFALLVFVLLAFTGVVLLSLALRYRVGTARRQARPWVTSLNVWATSLSAVFFLCFTLLLSFWIPSAFRFGLIGMGCGSILGLIGLAVTRWERRSEGLFYTPSRWLALLIIAAIGARILTAGGVPRTPERRSRRPALADDRFGNAALPGGCRRISSVLFDLLHRSASPTRASLLTFSEHRYGAHEWL